MKGIRIKGIEKELFYEENNYCIIVENQEFLFQIINSYLEKEEDFFMEFENLEEKDIYKSSRLITDFFALDYDSSKVLLDYVKKKRFDFQLDIQEIINEINMDVNDLISRIEIDSPLPIEFDDGLTCESLFKAAKPMFVKSNSRIERLLEYCKLILDIYGINLFFFFNFNMLFSSKEMEDILYNLRLNGIYVINISGTNIGFDQITGLNQIFIDLDLCEFYK